MLNLLLKYLSFVINQSLTIRRVVSTVLKDMISKYSVKSLQCVKRCQVRLNSLRRRPPRIDRATWTLIPTTKAMKWRVSKFPNRKSILIRRSYSSCNRLCTPSCNRTLVAAIVKIERATFCKASSFLQRKTSNRLYSANKQSQTPPIHSTKVEVLYSGKRSLRLRRHQSRSSLVSTQRVTPSISYPRGNWLQTLRWAIYSSRCIF